ncbi:MAG: CBM21 domain-containing protein [Clostridia bacterium]|nr:CBM21 domain-containing protein [Clostridia bacterium]
MNNKKTFSKLLSLTMAFCMLFVAASGVFVKTAQAATKPVELYYAKSPQYNPVGSFFAEGYVAIQNLGAIKKVTVRYTYNGSDWYDVAASYFRTTSDGLESWYFKTPSTDGSSTCTFAIKYDVNGTTYWDNNGGNNYKLAWYAPTFVLQKSVVIKDRVIKNDTSFSGTIVLKNLAYNKQVKVRYTTNNWATYKDVSATFGTDLGNGLESWNFTDVIPSGSTVKFSIYYIVNGVTYWDNNFGANYTI